MNIKLIILCAFVLITHVYAESKQVIQPYPFIRGSYTNESVTTVSPDPLVNYKWEDPKASDDLEIYILKPVCLSADDETALIRGSDTSSMKIIDDCYLMFDFGRISAGWFEFDSDNLDAEIEMSISEFNEPAVFNVGSQHPVKTAVPEKYGNSYRLKLNDQLYEGVRFGWIKIKNLKASADISSVRLVCQIKPTNYEGSFSCNDSMLTRIWYTGAYTVKLNLLKDYFGAILMERSDRHSWTGDAHTSQAASMVAFGNYDFVKANLLYTSTQYNGIASYSLYWVLSLVDYYNYTGDKKLVDDLLDNVCQKLNIAYEHYGKNPSLVFYGWDERLGGFENPNGKETQAAYKMLSIRAWNESSRMMRHAGYPDLADKYEKYAKDKIEELRKDADWMNGLGVHAASDAINAGFTDARENEILWNYALSDRLQRLSYSPFNQYFIIQAMAKMGRYAEAFTTIDDCWGGQIRYGGTTFFEVFRPSWNVISKPNDAPINNQCGYTSLTHPWSAGVTKWLTEEVLGVRPINPGFSTFSVLPHLPSHVSNIKGKVPTLYGTIDVSFDLASGQCNVTVPSKTTAIVGIPKAGRKIESIKLNRDNAEKIKADDAFVYYRLSEGHYEFLVSYSDDIATVQVEPKEEFVYELGTNITEDIDTQGSSWIGKYGSKGYLLCNYNGKGDNVMHLPDFIRDVTFNKEGKASWASASNDKRILCLNKEDGGGVTNMGCLMTQDPNVCMQTMTVDVQFKNKQQYQLSLYMVDWDHKSRRSALELFDLDNKKILMPVHMVRDYENGKYIIYHLDRSVRIRINQVHGPNAVLSGIFFD